jgi:tetratricopeptide (TPR) repeat protein
LPASGSTDSQPNADLIQSIWELSRLGIKPDSLKSIGGLVKAGAESELTRFLHAKCRDYPEAIRLLHVFRQFIRCKHEDALRNAFAANRQGLRDLFIGPNRKCIFPSETLLAKMGLNREIDRLLNHLDREPDHKPSLIDLARAYFLRSDWLNLCGVCEKILQLDPANVRAVADKARAISYMGRADDAVQLLEERLRKGSDPLLKFRLGQALILQARNSSVPEFLGLVVKKQQLTTEALRDARDPRVRMWIRLDMALDDLSVSDPLQLNPPRASDLERLHREYQSISEKGLSVLSRMNLVRGRTLAAYALYLVYLRDRHPKTEQLLRKTTQMDPYAALTTRAASASKSSEPPLVVREIKRKSARTN